MDVFALPEWRHGVEFPSLGFLHTELLDVVVLGSEGQHIGQEAIATVYPRFLEHSVEFLPGCPHEWSAHGVLRLPKGFTDNGELGCPRSDGSGECRAGTGIGVEADFTHQGMARS